MHTSRPFVWVAVLLVVGVAGYVGYQYVKNDPPDFLIKLFTAQEPAPPLPAGPAAPLVVPEGFAATIYARDLPGARVLVRDNQGTMLLSQTSAGKVVALPDADGDGVADETKLLLEGLDRPHGLAVVCLGGEACELYVAETGAVRAYPYDAAALSVGEGRFVVALPTAGGGHYTRTLLPHPDGEHLLVSVGSSCNVCGEETPVRASVQLLNLRSGNLTTYASGLRNTVFMALDPIDGEVWGTDNGRDLIGDDIPPDEINIIRQGRDYGWPICYGKNIHDTDYDRRPLPAGRQACADKEPSFIDLQAHSAALGLAFVPEEGWPDEWGNDLLVALHGSWNRSSPVGYKVVRVDLANDSTRQERSVTDFVTGFLPEGGRGASDSIGRPVAILAEPGGVAYISDDRAGAVYRISLTEPAR